MILQHPDHPKKKVVNRINWLLILHLKQEGWVDVTPPRSAKQLETTRKFLNSGQIERTRQNIMQVFRMEINSLTPEQRKTLNNAQIVCQQLSKKYRSKQT